MDQPEETLILRPESQVVSRDGFAVVLERLNTGRRGLFTLQSFRPGEVLCDFSAREILSGPNYLTVQLGLNRHITLQPEFLQYMNHSCAPNTFFDTTAMQVICLTEVKSNQELTFFYPSTEWEMAQPFACDCGQANCLGEIRGAAHLTMAVLQPYRLTEFIYQQLIYARRSSG